MSRRDTIGFLCIVLLTGLTLLIAYFYTPHPVVSNPETTQLSAIYIDRAPNGAENDTWIPLTDEQKETAQNIIGYLSTCQEVHCFRKGTIDGYPSDWNCITVMLLLPDGSTRGILLGPIGSNSNNTNTVNVSYKASGGSFSLFPPSCTLVHPEEIRSFILTALNLPADFM